MPFDGEGFGTEVAALVRSYVERVTGPMKAQIAALEARLAETEKRGPGLQYRGVWQRAEIYVRGDVTTYGGSAWFANRETEAGETPGAGDGWVLMVKRGKDGADR